MAYTVNTGLLTAFCATGCLVAVGTLSFCFCNLTECKLEIVKFAAAPDSYIYISFYFCLPKRESLFSVGSIKLLDCSYPDSVLKCSSRITERTR